MRILGHSNHRRLTSLLFVAATVIGFSPADAATERTIVGQITDSTCLVSGKKLDAEHAECARRCIQGGAPIAIVEDRTKKIFIALAREGEQLKDKLLPHVGRRCKITGELVRRGGSQFMVVRTVTPEHEHHSQEGGVVAMAGDLHLEVVAGKTGEVKVFLSDAFRKPLPVVGLGGRVELAGTAHAAPKSATLIPAPDGKFLTAMLPPLTDKQVELTIRLPLKKDPGYFITFMVEPSSTGAKPPHVHGVTARQEVTAGQDVAITVQGGYSPREIRLKKGVPARLRFDRKDSGACAGQVIIPGLGVKKDLAPLGSTVVEVTPKEVGEFEMTCGMNMLRARVVVTE